MCAKFGCGPTVVSKKKGGYRQTDRQRFLQLYIVDDWIILVIIIPSPIINESSHLTCVHLLTLTMTQIARVSMIAINAATFAMYSLS